MRKPLDDATMLRAAEKRLAEHLQTRPVTLGERDLIVAELKGVERVLETQAHDLRERVRRAQDGLEAHDLCAGAMSLDAERHRTRMTRESWERVTPETWDETRTALEERAQHYRALVARQHPRSLMEFRRALAPAVKATGHVSLADILRDDKSTSKALRPIGMAWDTILAGTPSRPGMFWRDNAALVHDGVMEAVRDWAEGLGKKKHAIPYDHDAIAREVSGALEEGREARAILPKLRAGKS